MPFASLIGIVDDDDIPAAALRKTHPVAGYCAECFQVMSQLLTTRSRYVLRGTQHIHMPTLCLALTLGYSVASRQNLMTAAPSCTLKGELAAQDISCHQALRSMSWLPISTRHWALGYRAYRDDLSLE